MNDLIKLIASCILYCYLVFEMETTESDKCPV